MVSRNCKLERAETVMKICRLCLTWKSSVKPQDICFSKVKEKWRRLKNVGKESALIWTKWRSLNTARRSIAFVRLFWRPSGAAAVMGHQKYSGLTALRVPSFVALKVMPQVQFGQEAANDSISKPSCRDLSRSKQLKAKLLLISDIESNFAKQKPSSKSMKINAFYQKNIQIKRMLWFDGILCMML